MQLRLIGIIAEIFQHIITQRDRKYKSRTYLLLSNFKRKILRVRLYTTVIPTSIGAE